MTIDHESEHEARFERRLDRWLSSYRVAIAAPALILIVFLAPNLPWLWACGLVYLVAALAVFPLLRLLSESPHGRLKVRLAILVADVVTVSVVNYAWGPRASPAAFMYVPIVVGWALLPQRLWGRLALAFVLSTMGTLVWFDTSTSAPPFPIAWMTGSGRLLFFGLFASIMAAVHELLSFTVAGLHEHARVVSALLAEQRAQERDAEWAAKLEDAQRLEALGRLAGGVAHDFNNLLTVLIGSSELAERLLTKDPAAAQRALRSIQEAAERASRLTSQLLEFASRRPEEPREIDLKQQIVATAQLSERLLPSNVKLELQLSDEPCGVRLDPGGLERLLLNLCVNAVDAMPEGGTLTLAARPNADGERVLLEVRDTGVGIVATDLPLIFEPFFTRKPRGKGTGLGLASVYGIVRQNHGEIEVESEPQVGTTFRIQWPRVPLSAHETLPSTRPPAPKNATVLVVDDDNAVRGVLEWHLREAGYHVLSASSAADALSLLDQGHDLDLLITDVSMPVTSGIELARAVRQRGLRLPILLVSGYDDALGHGDTRADLKAAFLTKPFTSERLLSEVTTLLQRG